MFVRPSIFQRYLVFACVLVENYVLRQALLDKLCHHVLANQQPGNAC